MGFQSNLRGENHMENKKRDKVLVKVFNKIVETEHFHQDIELIYVLEGTLDVTIGNQVTHMKADDVVVINVNKRHYIRSSESTLFMQVSILYQMVSEVLNSIEVIFWCDSTKEESERYTELKEVLKVLLRRDLEASKSTANFGHIALCYRVVDILAMYFLVQTTDKESQDEKERFDDRIQQINNYICANYKHPISMKELADNLYLSNGYLSRFFKKNYGMNFVEYLTNIRLYHTVDELLYSKVPITRIAFENGFACMAVFNKAFKKSYGVTPTEFRKRAHEKKVNVEKTKADPVIEERLEKYFHVNEREEEEYTTNDVSKQQYSVKNSEKMKNYWGKMINIGAASDLLRSDVREHVILLKEALGFEFVRFWNIFSKEMLIDLNEKDGNYNFSRLDVIFDFLIQQGLKPHIEMAMKPRSIMYSVQKIENQSTDTELEFMNLDHWERVIQAMMHHLVFRYGREEVNQWRMELWFNENEWDQQDSYELYFKYFNKMYETVKNYCNGLEIGGCGLRMDFNEESRRRFFKEWLNQQHQPDFISVGQFAYDRGEEKQDKYSKKSTDNECVKHRISHERILINEAGGEHVKFYVSEWNLTASSRNYINDSSFKGAYIIKNILDIYGLVDDIGYFNGSDRTTEYYDSNLLLYGGTGLISRDSILKPAGFAFEFMKRLFPYYVGKSENYLITKDNHDSYGIICHNQRPLSYNYYYTVENELEKKEMWRYFEDRNSLHLEIDLKDVTDGIYQVKYYSINERNGSALDIWQDMGYEKELSRNDVRYFRRVCEPKLIIQQCEAKHNILKLKINLLANEIRYVKIRLIE